LECHLHLLYIVSIRSFFIFISKKYEKEKEKAGNQDE
jgi:hypothetical protein